MGGEKLVYCLTRLREDFLKVKLIQTEKLIQLLGKHGSAGGW